MTIFLDVFENIERCKGYFDLHEPQVSAFLPEAGRFERLSRQAQELLERCPDPSARPPLFGALVGVKDIFHVAGFETRAGSRLPPEELSGPQAECIERLKSAGALILGKTVTTEFAYFAPGPTRNPHNLEHTPGGSSSGSAAAVAAGACDLALGTQTIGSIVRPAAFCGVVGFKPSFGRVSTQGVIPLAPSLDHVGLFAANVAAASRAAQVIVQAWRAGNPPRRRPVLGVPRGAYLEKTSPEGMAHFQEVYRRLEAAGFEIRQVTAMPDFDEIRARHERLLAYEAARVHAHWFARHSERYAPRTAQLIRRGRDVSPAEYASARRGQAQLCEQLAALMSANGIDLWITPAAPGTAPRGLSTTGDPVMNLPWTQAGMPSLNVPSGRDQAGLPFGLQVIGGVYADEALLAWAQDLEKTLEVA